MRVSELEVLKALSLTQGKGPVGVQGEITASRGGREVSYTQVFVLLNSLVERGFAAKKFCRPENETERQLRGGRVKALYTLTKAGERLLAELRAAR